MVEVGSKSQERTQGTYSSRDYRESVAIWIDPNPTCFFFHLPYPNQISSSAAAEEEEKEVEEERVFLLMANTTAKVYVIYYSVYGHVGTMAREILRGANSVEGVEATLWQIPETLPDRVLEKMKAPPKDTDVAVIRPEQLAEADGFVFGSPSRFGMMASQVLAFFDATHELWVSQKLAGKPAGIFWSTGFHGGGQENTALTAIPQLAHHGILYVPLGYTFGSGMFEIDEVKGGSSYGAGTYAGDGSRQPTELELQQAFYQGKYVAGITKKLKATST